MEDLYRIYGILNDHWKNEHGLGNPFAENILEVAFAAGWTAAVSAAEHVVEKVIDSKKKAPNE